MINLKKIEMYGFKSFADKIEMRFNQPITGIVGPNGCGKSNVSDAIRWVLGEQSTKMLRGKSMQDLIFAGTDKRKSMSYCEVSLYVDNSNRIFPIEMDEVIISRKLYRNGDSEYLLNKNIVRLKDIQDLLRSVGLGKEGYSIVGQGRMDAILNARPEDRRAIFEEALGISRFRVKKVETERKLDKTKINMDSLNILATELERQIAPLTKQASVARKYLDFASDLKYHEVNSYIYNYDHASIHKDNCRKKLFGLQEEFALREGQYGEVNAQYNELIQSMASMDTTLSELNEKRVNLAVAIERKSGEKNVLSERYKNVKNEIDSTSSTIEQLTKEITEYNSRIEEGKAILSDKQEELNNLECELSVDNENFAKVSAEVERIKVSIEATQGKVDSINKQISDLTFNQASYKAEIKQLDTRLAQIDAQTASLTSKLTKLSGEEGNILTRYENSRNQKNQLTATLDQLSQSIKNQEFAIFEHNKKVNTAQQQLASEKGSIELLSDFANNFKGYQASVQSLMQDAKHNTELSSRIRGVVANLINVDNRLLVAIETALGGRLQNVVTDNEEDAKYLINYLKDNNSGRVTFLPISSMKPSRIDRREVLQEEGVLGIAVDLIGYDKCYDNVFRSLLGGILIVDSYNNAIRLSRKYGYNHRMVTLSGERIATDGSIEGGATGKNNRASLLSYDSQLSARQDKLAVLSQQVDDVVSEHKGLTDDLARCKKMHNDLNAQLVQLEVSIATDKERIESSSIINSGDKQSILGLQSEKDDILVRLEHLKDSIANQDSTVEQLQLDMTELKMNLLSSKNNLESKTATREAMQEALSAKRLRLGVLKSNIELSIKSLDNNILEVYKIEQNKAQKITYVEQVIEAGAILSQTLSEGAVDCDESNMLAELIETINTADVTKSEMSERFNKVSDERMRLSSELEGLRGAIDKEEYILVKIDEDLLQLQARVQEEYEITYSEAMEIKDDNYDPTDSKKIISDLRLSINRLGYVNVNAIEELATVKERFGGIDEQLEDLRKADSDLREVLKQLTVEIQSRFDIGMEKINENFKVVFRELFNGGNAKLSIEREEGKDVLDFGVEIEAQPPGKKLQNISLLSGGERTLTAAAILFAILKLSPMPFCVLDEIEAALDDSNADRIAKYLRNFSESTQFVVITHKKPTMENADILYGVTMEEKGVSKVVSVKLSEAVESSM